MRARTFAGVLIALFGLALSTTEFVLYFIAQYKGKHYDVNAWVMFASVIICFVGGFILDAKKSEDAADFVFQRGYKILKVIRGTGRREGDATIVDDSDEIPKPPTPPAS